MKTYLIIYLIFVFCMDCIIGYYPQHFYGKYKVLYPKKKIILFTEVNNEIIERKLLHLKLHPKHRQFYHIMTFDPFHLLLQNKDNCTDILLLQEMNIG